MCLFCCVSVYVCVCVCVFVCGCVWVCLGVSECVWVCMCVMESVCDSCVLVKKVNCTFMFEFVLLCLCVYVCLFVRVCVCVYSGNVGFRDYRFNICLAIFILPQEKTIVPMYSHTDQHYFKTHEFCSNSQKQRESSICTSF